MSDSNKKYEIARKIALNKLAFIRHAITYVIVIAGLAVINNVTGRYYQWWLWPAFGWGIGVLSHFFGAYLFQSGKLADKLTQQELDRLNE